MLRRRLLTAAVAAPALMLGGRAAASALLPSSKALALAAAKCYPAAACRRLDAHRGRAITPRPAAWILGLVLVFSVGTSIQNCDGGGYTQPYLTQEQWWLAFYNAYSVYAGARPLPQGTVQVSSPDDSMARGLRDERGYLDHKDISATFKHLDHLGNSGRFRSWWTAGSGGGCSVGPGCHDRDYRNRHEDGLSEQSTEGGELADDLQSIGTVLLERAVIGLCAQHRRLYDPFDLATKRRRRRRLLHSNLLVALRRDDGKVC